MSGFVTSEKPRETNLSLDKESTKLSNIAHKRKIILSIISGQIHEPRYIWLHSIDIWSGYYFTSTTTFSQKGR